VPNFLNTALHLSAVSGVQSDEESCEGISPDEEVRIACSAPAEDRDLCADYRSGASADSHPHLARHGPRGAGTRNEPLKLLTLAASGKSGSNAAEGHRPSFRKTLYRHQHLVVSIAGRGASADWALCWPIRNLQRRLRLVRVIPTSPKPPPGEMSASVAEPASVQTTPNGCNQDRRARRSAAPSTRQASG
jgi:hypothetical protein